MKFQIGRDELLKPLLAVGGVINKRSTQPLLTNLMLQIRDHELTLIGSDSEVELRSRLPVEGEDLDTTLPGKTFIDICRTLPEGAILQITIDGDRAVIRSGRSRFTLTTLPADHFPLLERGSQSRHFSIEQALLKDLLERTQVCMANQDVRYFLNGVLLESGEGVLRAVATDGHRLALCEYPLDTLTGELLQQVILPRKGALELSRLLEKERSEVEVEIHNNHIRVLFGDNEFISKLIDGSYPEYQRVFPSGCNKQLIAPRRDLIESLRRASILSNEKFRATRLLMENNLLRVTVNNPEQEEAEEELEVSYPVDYDRLEIGFNVTYLLDALNGFETERVQIDLVDGDSSVLITGFDDTSGRYVIMPMRL